MELFFLGSFPLGYSYFRVLSLSFDFAPDSGRNSPGYIPEETQGGQLLTAGLNIPFPGAFPSSLHPLPAARISFLLPFHPQGSHLEAPATRVSLRGCPDELRDFFQAQSIYLTGWPTALHGPFTSTHICTQLYILCILPPCKIQSTPLTEQQSLMLNKGFSKWGLCSSANGRALPLPTPTPTPPNDKK